MRHLHKDDRTSWCGLDAVTELMTFDPTQTDCPDCQTNSQASETAAAAAEATAVAQAQAADIAGAEQLAAREAAMVDIARQSGS